VGTSLGPEGEVPLVGWSSAYLRERFGDARAHGMDPLIELRLVDADVQWALTRGLPRFHRLDLTVFGLWTVPREPALARDRWYSGLAWGGEWRTTRRDSLIDTVQQVRGGLLFQLVGKASDPHHLLLRAGPEVRVWHDLWPGGVATGGFVQLTQRVALPGNGTNGARLGVTWSPLYALWRPGMPRVAHEVEADLAVQLTDATARPWGLEAGGWLSVEASAEGTRTTGGVRAQVKVR
jgi:hypothetical protein